MDQVLQIPLEANEAESRRQRMETLKAKVFSGQDPQSQRRLLQEELFGEKNSEIFELRKSVRYGNVDKFVDVLEQLSSKKKLALSVMFEQVTPAGDSLLHEAAYFGRARIAELIAHHFPHLLTKTNIDGDTPLHVAARSKSSSVIKVILSQYEAAHAHNYSSSPDIITRLTNEYGNTALHEAAGSKHVEAVSLLFEADKCVAHYLNKSQKSPLYMAVLSSSKDIVNVLLEAPFPDDRPLPKCHGNSPLHAAIYTKNAVLLKEILKKRSDLMYQRDEEGGTPLHYAAATGYAEGVGILLKKSSVAGLEYNTKGHLPIHLASKRGRVKVLKEFLQQQWSDPRVLLNKKGQNILHVATKNERSNVVKYILRHTKFKQLTINKKDKNGNTPLHLAAENFDPFIVLDLTKEKRIDVNLMNNEGLTPRDTLLVKSERPMTIRQLSNWVLKFGGAKISDKATRILRRQQQPLNVEKMKDRMEILMLVTILTVTVSFAAGFTVPGGVYSSDDPNPRVRGMAVLGHKPMFKVFVVTDTIAMYSSTLGSLLLLAAQVGKYSVINAYIISLFLVRLALMAMALAFMAAISLVVSNVTPLYSFTIYIGLISFCSILSSSNASRLAFCIYVVPLYCLKPLNLFFDFTMPSYKHQSSASEEE